MKKALSITILLATTLFSLYMIIVEMTIKPIITMYHIYGLKGAIIYFIIEVVVFVALYFFITAFRWAMRNLF